MNQNLDKLNLNQEIIQKYTDELIKIIEIK